VVVKKLLIALLGMALLPLPGLAQNWNYSVDNRDGNLYYVDTASIRRENNLVYFQVKKMKATAAPGFAARVHEHTVSMKTGSASAQEQRIANCKQHTMSTKEYVYYSETGEVTGSMTYPSPTFNPVSGDSANGKLLKFVCTQEVGPQATAPE
jgi:hypothetical protein